MKLGSDPNFDITTRGGVEMSVQHLTIRGHTTWFQASDRQVFIGDVLDLATSPTTRDSGCALRKRRGSRVDGDRRRDAHRHEGSVARGFGAACRTREPAKSSRWRRARGSFIVAKRTTRRSYSCPTRPVRHCAPAPSRPRQSRSRARFAGSRVSCRPSACQTTKFGKEPSPTGVGERQGSQTDSREQVGDDVARSIGATVAQELWNP